jgi:hypothetical protein
MAQAKELAQLALNIEKLAQFKQILTDLKKGYEILLGGYNTIKNLASNNFNLHKAFLDGLMAVNPAVKKYWKVADIVNIQLALVDEYKKAIKLFKHVGAFTSGEIDYIEAVYSKLFNESLKNLDALLTMITADKLRMSDDERLTGIDGIYTEMADKLSFLRYFNNNTSILAIQRTKEQHDVNTSESLYGIKK